MEADSKQPTSLRNHRVRIMNPQSCLRFVNQPSWSSFNNLFVGFEMSSIIILFCPIGSATAESNETETWVRTLFRHESATEDL